MKSPAAALTALCLTTVLLGSARIAGADTAREFLDRARQLDDTTRHWTDRTEKMTLVIVDGRGGERRRELRTFTKRYPGDEDKSLSFFLAPPEVKGTGFLQWAHKQTDDDQWLYLPEFKRTRRITAQLKDESFMGTDFSYRDLSILGNVLRWTEAEASATLKGEEKIDDHQCHVIDLHPKQEGMSYGRLVLWLDEAQLVVRRLDFYDKDDARQKTLALRQITDVGVVPTAHELEMQHVIKGSHTQVTIDDIKYDTQLSDDLFTQRYLERGEL